MSKVIVAIVLIFGIAATLFAWHAGFFTPVRITEVQAGPYILVYQAHTGDYALSSQIMDNIFNVLKAQNIHTTQGFGIYFDDPRKVEKLDLRSVVGNILDPADQDKLEIIKKQYRVNTFPQQKCLQVIFPYRSPLSIMAGIMKVYPAVGEYSKARQLAQHAAMEVYDLAGKKIIYLFPLEPEEDLVKRYFDTPESAPPSGEVPPAALQD
jgi:hypothetical protein